MMATAWVLDARIRWLGKHTLFAPPFGWFFRAMGGIPVDRRAPQGLVGQVVERFAVEEDLMLGIPEIRSLGTAPQVGRIYSKS